MSKSTWKYSSWGNLYSTEMCCELYWKKKHLIIVPNCECKYCFKLKINWHFYSCSLSLFLYLSPFLSRSSFFLSCSPTPLLSLSGRQMWEKPHTLILDTLRNMDCLNWSFFHHSGSVLEVKEQMKGNPKIGWCC